VGFFEASLGPRLAIAPELLPGWTVKPYVVGGASGFDGARFGSAGGGVTFGVPLHARVSIEPFVEWRQVSFDDRRTEVASTLGSGGGITAGLGTTIKIAEGVTLQTRSAYRSVDARLPWQSFDQFINEAAVNIEFDPPMARLSGISCLGGHDGWKGAPACQDAKNLVSLMPSWTSFWLVPIRRQPLIRTVFSTI